MKRIGLFLLAVVMVAGLAGCSGGDDGTTVRFVVIDNAEKDDIFEISIDNNILGRTDLSAEGKEFVTELDPGVHRLRIQYVGATDGDGRGSYLVNFSQGATFSNSAVTANGTIDGLMNSHEGDIVVID